MKPSKLHDNSKSSAEVVAKLPRTGLGNMLLVWAKALTFARHHSLPLLTLGWHQFRPGPWLRRENVKRWYGSSFDDGAPAWKRIAGRMMLYGATRRGDIMCEPELNSPIVDGCVYLFERVPRPPNYFDGLHPFRELIKAELVRMLRPTLRTSLENATPPEIAIHVRRGDFKIADQVSRLKNKGSLITPISAFLAAAEQARQIAGRNASITVFTDGDATEIKPLLELGNCKLAPRQPDILDIMLMSRARLLIPSAKSTFGYWAAFMSQQEVIRIPYDDMAKMGENEILLASRVTADRGKPKEPDDSRSVSL